MLCGGMHQHSRRSSVVGGPLLEGHSIGKTLLSPSNSSLVSLVSDGTPRCGTDGSLVHVGDVASMSWGSATEIVGSRVGSGGKLKQPESVRTVNKYSMKAKTRPARGKCDNLPP